MTTTLKGRTNGLGLRTEREKEGEREGDGGNVVQHSKKKQRKISATKRVHSFLSCQRRLNSVGQKAESAGYNSFNDV